MKRNFEIVKFADLRKILRTLRVHHELDMTEYAASSLLSRVEIFIVKSSVFSTHELINRIEGDKLFAEKFVQAILPREDEMLRDSEFWIKWSEIINANYSNQTELNIWLPDSNSFHELYSQLVILHRLDMIENTTIHISTLSKMTIEEIKNNYLLKKHLKTDIGNFNRFDETIIFDDYFDISGDIYRLRADLLYNVKISYHNYLEEEIYENFDMVLFRNKMIYYNSILKQKAIRKITSNIKDGGYLAIGIKESLKSPIWQMEYLLFDKSESIYKKK